MMPFKPQFYVTILLVFVISAVMPSVILGVVGVGMLAMLEIANWCLKKHIKK